MSKHTPGPWTVTEFGDAIVVEAIQDNGARYQIAEVAFSSEELDEQNEANANLLGAAPLMYQALRELIAERSAGGFHAHLGNTVGLEWAIESIAKADGK